MIMKQLIEYHNFITTKSPNLSKMDSLANCIIEGSNRGCLKSFFTAKAQRFFAKGAKKKLLKFNLLRLLRKLFAFLTVNVLNLLKQHAVFTNLFLPILNP